MATIRPQQLAPVNLGDSNQLMLAAQRLIQQGLGDITNTVNQARQNVVDRNTATAVNLLTGAQNIADLNQRQSQVADILRAAGGDINNEAVQRAQLTMPDTLLNRASTQNRLTAFDQQQHDQPLLNQAMSLYAAGDTQGANRVLAGVQGDASSALKFGVDRADTAFAQNIQRQQLGIQQAGLALRRQAANQRAAAAKAGNTQVNNLLKSILTNNTTATQEDTQAAVKFENQQLADAEKNNPLNNPKSNLTAAVGALNDQSWFVNRGDSLQRLASKLPGYDKLTDSQKVNLLNGMNTAFEQNNGWTSSTNPDKAAQDWAKDAIDSLSKTQSSQLSNQQLQIQQKRTSNNERAALLLRLLQSNGQLDPLALQNLNIDEE